MDFFTASDGAQIAYRDTGAQKGPPLLCLAGLTRTVADFDYLAPHLPDVRMICMDYRGRGASQWTGAATYTVPIEARDAIELLDHLGLQRAPVLGTSRGGLIGIILAALAKDRISGLCMNDIGPEIARAGLERIFDYVGRSPSVTGFKALAAALRDNAPGFENIPDTRWMEEAKKHYTLTDKGMQVTYDPALRDAFLAAFEGEMPDLWPAFDALDGLPVALIRGANSDLLTPQTVAEMQRRRPDLIFAEVPDRAHIPFLDEPEAVIAIRAFLKAVA
jgi:pimeloyl-ACP methyl ester carboxylesterase